MIYEGKERRVKIREFSLLLQGTGIIVYNVGLLVYKIVCREGKWRCNGALT